MPRPRSLRSLTIAPNTLKRSISPGPPSPTFSDTSHASAMNFGADGPHKIITRSHLRASLHAYEELMNRSAKYRAALLAMAKATSAFADAMEQCSVLKGPSYEAGTRLQAAAGLHHLIGNHWLVLAEALDKNFEQPLRQHLEEYRTVVTERSIAYEQALYEKSHIIRQTEMKSMNRKERNLQSFREALVVLQRQVDELDTLKAQHYQEILEHEEEVWDVVQGKASVVVRSTMDVFDKFTSKASDPVIEPMLQSVPDPFNSYGPPREEDQIFSILPPLSIMNPPSSTDSPLATTPDHDPAPEMSSTSSSWEPIKGGCFPDTSTQWSDAPHSLRSISPPTAARRHSHPPSSGHPQRKSESKLKSVLSVIDENHSRQPSHEEEDHSEEPQTPPAANGTTVETDYSWNEVGFEDTETRPVTEVDVPRNLDWSLPPKIPPGVPDLGRDDVDQLVEDQPLATISPC